MTIDELHPKIEKVVENIESVIVGKRKVAILSMVALLAEGHVLLEDVPGVGKTMLVKALAKSVDAKFSRIQFTPDLLPSDVTGSSIYHPRDLEFQFRPGPIMGNIILADEINRTSPKTQSALLEGLEERGVTIDGVTHELKRPFFVMATQNPIEYEGTYPLPEAQLDRFLLKIKMGYPEVDEEIDVLTRALESPPLENLTRAIDLETLLLLQDEVKKVFVEESLKRYIVDLATKTRNHRHVYLGVSPRGSIALMKAAQAYAFIHHREYIIPDDIQYLAPFVFTHRLILTADASFEGITAEIIIRDVVAETHVPIQRSLSK